MFLLNTIWIQIHVKLGLFKFSYFKTADRWDLCIDIISNLAYGQQQPQ